MASDVPSSSGAASHQALDEDEEIEQALRQEMRKEAPMTAAGCLLRGSVITALLTVLLCGSGYYVLQVWIARFAAKRDALIKDLRAKGEPLVAEDMAKFTALPEGTNDLTERYLSIVQNYVRPSPLSAEEELLPIVGAKATVAAVPGPGISWAEEEIAKSYLANRPWLKDAEELAEVEGEISIQRDFSQGYATILPDIQANRGLVRDLQLQFQMRMRTGDRAGALRSLRAMFKASGALKHEPFIISQRVRVAIHAVSVQSASEFIRDRKATPREIASLREMLDNDFRAGLIKGLKGERAIGLITLRSSDFNELNSLVAASPNTMPNLPTTSNVADMRPGDTAKLLEMLTELIDVVEENDFPEIMKQFKIQEDEFKQMVADEKTALPWNRHLLPTLLMPMVQEGVTGVARGSALEAALKAALDVEEKLLALPPGERTTEAEIAAIEEFLPIDPFTSQPMKYVVDDQGYKIYSVGADGVDDNGPDGKHNKDAGVWIERTLDGSATSNPTE